MRYRIAGRELRSENTAKPIHRAAKFLREWLESLPPLAMGIDYGCGKLRYAVTLAGRVDRLVLVDSEVQLRREQIIDGRRTSVRTYVSERWPRSLILSEREFRDTRLKADFALCANVLSAVPTPRARAAVVDAIASHLRVGACALFVVQYRNSHFSAWRVARHARPYRDGWLVQNQRGTSFYGLIRLPKLEELVTTAGMQVETSWTRGEAAYVLAKVPSAPQRKNSRT